MFNKLEWKFLNEINDYLHINFISSREEEVKLIYEFCYLRLLSLRMIKGIVNIKPKITLEEFVTECSKYLNTNDNRNIYYITEEETMFENKRAAFELGMEVLKDIEKYNNSLKDIDRLLCILCSYNDQTLKNVMIIDLYDNNRRIFNTPSQVCKLSNYILDISKDDEVLDLYSGDGNYLTNVITCSNYKKLSGIEPNYDLSLISKIRLMSLSSNYSIDNDNIFNINTRKKFDKIFCQHPLGLKYTKSELDYMQETNMIFKWERMSGSSIDWIYINLTISLLKENGKAIVMLPAGPLFKNVDRKYREDLIEKGYIDSIIKIPTLTRYTGIQQYLLVLEKNNNKYVKFIDLSEQVEKINSFTFNMNMAKVFEILNDDENLLIKKVDKKMLKDNDYILTADNYIGKKEIKYYNPKKLSDFVIDVFRGYQITAREQKEQEDENGEYEVLLISDIDDGRISDNLTRINPEKDKYKRYLIKKDDLIISSKGTRIKTAVVGDIEDRKIIASGNLIVLRVDTKKIDPEYLEMYLNSSDGKSILNSIQTGSIIISINPSKLINITISTLSIEKQKKLAEMYKGKKYQIQLAKEHLLKLEEEQENFFENNIEGMFD